MIERPINDIEKVRWYRELVINKGYKWFDKDGELNIIGLRGYDIMIGQHSNKPIYNKKGKFKGRLYDDTIAFIWKDTKWNIKEFEATTDPGVVHRPKHPKSIIATLRTGQYFYIKGTHHKIEGAANPAIYKKGNIAIYISYLKDLYKKKNPKELFKHLRIIWGIPQKMSVRKYIKKNAGVKFLALKDIPDKYKYNKKIDVWRDFNQNGIIDEEEKKDIHKGTALNIHWGVPGRTSGYVGDYSEGCQVINMIPYTEIMGKEFEIKLKLEQKYDQKFNKYMKNIGKNGIIGENKLFRWRTQLIEKFIKNNNVDIPPHIIRIYESWKEKVLRKTKREKNFEFNKERNKWYKSMKAQRQTRFKKEITSLFEKSKRERFSYVLIDLSI